MQEILYLHANLFKLHNYITLLSTQMPHTQFQRLGNVKLVVSVYYFINLIWLKWY